MSSLQINIVEFADTLRHAGVRISTSEILDAFHAFEYIDILDREQVKTVLSSCFVKSKSEQDIYIKAFDLFFSLPEIKTEYIKKRIDEIDHKRQEIIDEASSLEFQGEMIELSQDLKEAYAALPEENKEKIRSYLSNTSAGKNVRPEFKNVVENIVKGMINASLSQSKQDMQYTNTVLGRDLSNSAIFAEDIKRSLYEEDNLLNKNLGTISNEDIPRMIILIKKISDMLKKDVSRKFKKTGDKRGLDFKRTIRCNLNTGGMLFDLKFKRRSARKLKYLILCDVSASMYTFSNFVLQFISGMTRGNSNIRCCIFSDGVEKLNFSSYHTFEEFERRIKESSIWLKGTNINIAFDYILEPNNLLLNSSTVILVISDCRTMEHEKALNNLEIIRSKAKKIFWMNPLPGENWSKVASVNNFAKYCSMLDCSTLERLCEACRLI